MSDRLMTADTPAPLTELSEWKRFALAAQTCAPRPDALDLIEAPGLALDSSGQRHSPELMAAGEALLRARDFETQRERLLAGD
ncbi:MAG TPA: glucose-6-phosphate isomerase, partial [Castellaniella sp.]|nr:glucose-6-phosphate isomerase [Castellaniella sp.]